MISVLCFWLSLAALIYHTALYGLILFVINLFKSKGNSAKPVNLATITVLCPAFNEEKVIEAKIESFLKLNYPKELIQMWVLSDDSTDATNDIVKKYEDQNIRLFIQKPRKGKQAAHNMVLDKLQSDFVLSTDANTLFAPDSVSKLLQCIQQDPDIGIVSGELRLQKASSGQSGEGIYWRYESFLKKMDSDFYSIIGANGSIFLIRSELFVRIPEHSVDDFERTLYVLSKGYKAKYVPEAIGFEEETVKATEEISRKIRIITQEWSAMKRMSFLLNPFRFPKLSFLLVSHKLIRWLFFIFAFGLLISSATMLNTMFYRIVFSLQVIFYMVGTLGLIAQSKGFRIPATGMASYITAMVWSSLVAYKNFLFNKQFGTWTPVR